MRFDTVENIILKVLTELGLVSGTGSQIYTEPQIVDHITASFDTIFTKRFWPHLTKTTTHTLDGAAGVITDTLVGVTSYDDIEWVRYSPYSQAQTMKRLQGREWQPEWQECIDIIPYNDTHWDTKFFRVYPVSYANTIKVRARRHPGNINTGIIPFDWIALKHLAASNILASDGMNVTNAQRQLALFESRYEDLITAEVPEFDEPTPYREDYFTVAP